MIYVHIIRVGLFHY